MAAGGLGLVQTQRASSSTRTTRSSALRRDARAGRGRLRDLRRARRRRLNAVFVCHALTGDAHAAGHHGDPARRGWWDTIIGPGRPLDTDRFFVVSPNLLGGCGGTTGPSSIDPRTGRAYGLRFPLITVRDLVAVHRALLAHLGIARLHAAIGGSLGGMQALQWALDYPDEVAARRADLRQRAADHAEHRALGRRPRGDHRATPTSRAATTCRARAAPNGGCRSRGRIGHITYLSEESMRRKFGRARRGGDGAPMTMASDFEVEHYLDYQGESFVERFDALSYLYLTRLMDYFDPFADPDLDLARVASPRRRRRRLPRDLIRHRLALRQRALAQHRRPAAPPAAHEPATSRSTSPWGHDSFLLELEPYHRLVADALAGPVSAKPPGA